MGTKAGGLAGGGGPAGARGAPGPPAHHPAPASTRAGAAGGTRPGRHDESPLPWVTSEDVIMATILRPDGPGVKVGFTGRLPVLSPFARWSRPRRTWPA